MGSLRVSCILKKLFLSLILMSHLAYSGDGFECEHYLTSNGLVTLVSTEASLNATHFKEIEKFIVDVDQELFTVLRPVEPIEVSVHVTNSDSRFLPWGRKISVPFTLPGFSFFKTKPFKTDKRGNCFLVLASNLQRCSCTSMLTLFLIPTLEEKYPNTRSL